MQGTKPVALVLAGVLTLVGCCTPGRQATARPAPPDPAEELVAALTRSLKLDALQQQKTRELLKQLAERDDKLHAEWAAGKTIDPHAPLVSRVQFERDFFGILTSEQQRVFQETRIRYIIQTRLGGRS